MYKPETINDSGVFLEIFEHLRKENLSTPKLVQRIQDIIVDHHKQMKHPYKENDIIESRFTSPENAYRWGVVSCGAVTNIASLILRSLNHEVQLIHGSIPNSKTHAWFKVKEENDWVEYVLTNTGCLPFEGRQIKSTCDNWEEIRSEIESCV